MQQHELEIAICEVKNRYNTQVVEKMQVIRQNKLQLLHHENEIKLIKASNCALQGEIEQLQLHMNQELLPLLKEHAIVVTQNKEANHD
ncbi:MAG: hypothetical protein IKS01_01325 [Paludibacteraceae bacterium]|nr:hypothetical protein [Paludibacteraceae bacterium]